MLIAQCRKTAGEALETYYAVFERRIQALRGTDLGPDWDGVYAMTTK